MLLKNKVDGVLFDDRQVWKLSEERMIDVFSAYTPSDSVMKENKVLSLTRTMFYYSSADNQIWIIFNPPI